MKYRPSAALAAPLLVVALAACGGGGGEEAPSTETASASTQSPDAGDSETGGIGTPASWPDVFDCTRIEESVDLTPVLGERGHNTTTDSPSCKTESSTGSLTIGWNSAEGYASAEAFASFNEGVTPFEPSDPWAWGVHGDLEDPYIGGLPNAAVVVGLEDGEGNYFYCEAKWLADDAEAVAAEKQSAGVESCTQVLEALVGG